MKALGTILPTATRDARVQTSVAGDNLHGLARRIIGGEVRYYESRDTYAIVSRQGSVLWFAVGADGDRRI